MILLESTLTADLVQSMGDDLSVVNAARVSLQKHSEAVGAADIGLIKFLMKNRHTSPFEHTSATFLIDAPIFVAREWHRHRTQSYNEVSGRYSKLQMRFYVPAPERPLVQQGKPGEYTFTPGTTMQYVTLLDSIHDACHRAEKEYEQMLEAGIAKEVARMVLPVNTYTSWYATANLLNWLRFLDLRTHGTAMWEIRQLAWQVHDQLVELYPVSMEAWAERDGL